MKKIAIIYWSGTGNTEAIAQMIKSATESSCEVKLLNVGEATKEDIICGDVIILGSPSMGNEVIEETEMEPFVESISSIIAGKKVILFGSYGWGDGQWMRDWKDRMEGYGANVLCEIICQDHPGVECEVQCKDIARLI